MIRVCYSFKGLVNRCPRALVKETKKENFKVKITLFMFFRS